VDHAPLARYARLSIEGDCSRHGSFNTHASQHAQLCAEDVVARGDDDRVNHRISQRGNQAGSVADRHACSQSAVAKHKGRRGDAAHDRLWAHDGCRVRELSPIKLAAREGSSKLRRRRSRWRRWRGEWHRRIWLYCVHPDNWVEVVRYHARGACQEHEARGARQGTRAARDRASGPRDGIGSASRGLCREVGARHGCAA